MDKAERDRLQEQIERMVFPGERVRGLDGATVLSLLDALDAAEAGSVPLHIYDAALRRWEAADAERDAARRERDAARAEAARYREVLRTLEQRLSQGAPEISPAYTGWVVAMRNLARAALAAADMASDVTEPRE